MTSFLLNLDTSSMVWMGLLDMFPWRTNSQTCYRSLGSNSNFGCLTTFYIDVSLALNNQITSYATFSLKLITKARCLQEVRFLHLMANDPTLIRYWWMLMKMRNSFEVVGVDMYLTIGVCIIGNWNKAWQKVGNESLTFLDYGLVVV
jgi:hypothetical protein